MTRFALRRPAKIPKGLPEGIRLFRERRLPMEQAEPWMRWPRSIVKPSRTPTVVDATFWNSAQEELVSEILRNRPAQGPADLISGASQA